MNRNNQRTIAGVVPLESAIVKQIRDVIARCGGRATKIHGGNYQEPGISDLLVCLDGKFIAIEVKRPGGKATPIQSQYIEEIKRAGGIAFVAHSVDEVVKELGLNVKLYKIA